MVGSDRQLESDHDKIPARPGAKVEQDFGELSRAASQPVQLHGGRAREHRYKRAGSSLVATSAGCVQALWGAGRMPTLPLSTIHIEKLFGVNPRSRAKELLLRTRHLPSAGGRLAAKGKVVTAASPGSHPIG
jgi:hypothetical protein